MLRRPQGRPCSRLVVVRLRCRVFDISDIAERRNIGHRIVPPAMAISFPAPAITTCAIFATPFTFLAWVTVLEGFSAVMSRKDNRGPNGKAVLDAVANGSVCPGRTFCEHRGLPRSR
jgi:hypothetical protein